MLIYALRYNNFHAVQFLVENGADVNFTDPIYNFENITLAEACSSCSLPVIQYLVDRGAHVNPQLNNPYTPLMYAVCFNSIDVITFLIDRGASIHVFDFFGENLIAKALFRKDPEREVLDIVKLLVNRGADVHHTNLLLFACELQLPSVVEYLQKVM
jgi:ankyrin repeat protein